MGKLVEVAIAILYRDDRVFLQLRDDNPEIVYPGVWGFFGGHIEPGETSEMALIRELKEEIGFTPTQTTYFCQQESERARRHIFSVPFTAALDSLSLNEGQDWGWATAVDVAAGSAYSERLQARRTIAPPHQQILLRFLAADKGRQRARDRSTSSSNSSK